MLFAKISLERADKQLVWIVKQKEREWTSLLIKANITSNKLQKFEAVSKLWKRHRSHHIQNVVPNVMARHQLLDTTQAIGTFPITKISPGSVRKSHFSAS